MTRNLYQLAARVWFRESTGEWVLEVSGEINGTYFNSRHTQSGNLRPEDVAGLPELHAEAARYRWLRVRIAGSDHVAELVEFNNWKDELGREVDTAIDTARAAAAGGEGVL